MDTETIYPFTKWETELERDMHKVTQKVRGKVKVLVGQVEPLIP